MPTWWAKLRAFAGLTKVLHSGIDWLSTVPKENNLFFYVQEKAQQC